MIRRFYRDVAVQECPGGWQVTLDGREIKTVGGAAQIAVTLPLAEALAAEWAQQGEKIDPATLPLRDLADYAIDVVAADTAAIARDLISYAETDTLCYRADPDAPLYARQLAVWEPLLEEFERRHALRMVRVSGIVHRPQDAAAMAVLEARVAGYDPFVLAAMAVQTKLAASLVTALLALDSDAEPPVLALWQAACLEEEWQAELWGRDAEAEARRIRRADDFLRAWQFARLAMNGRISA